MKTRLIVAGVFISLLFGCGGGGGSDQGTAAPNQTPEVDAAQTEISPKETSPVQTSLVEEPTLDAVISEPEMEVDFETRQIFLPMTGWLSEDEFWDVYYNDPAKLPGNVDFDALQKLGYRDDVSGDDATNQNGNEGA